MLLANPKHDPEVYRIQFERGKLAKEKREPEEPKCWYGLVAKNGDQILETCFHYSYEGGAWLDGYRNNQP